MDDFLRLRAFLLKLIEFNKSPPAIVEREFGSDDRPDEIIPIILFDPIEPPLTIVIGLFITLFKSKVTAPPLVECLVWMHLLRIGIYIYILYSIFYFSLAVRMDKLMVKE